MELGIPLIIVAVVLFAVGILLRRNRPARPDTIVKKAAKPEEDVDLFVHPRPKVAEMHVAGVEAQVTFDVPMPDHADAVLSELLVHEAVEVVREKRHTLPIDQVTEVVAIAGGKVVGRRKLETPGTLPPRSTAPSILSLSTIAADPLEHQFEAPIESVPGTAVQSRGDELAAVGSEIHLPKAIETGLRAQGIDPETMSAAELVTGMLALVGYQVSSGPNPGTYIATKGGQRTYIAHDAYTASGHPEVDESTIRKFIFEFSSSGAARGLLVSEKYAPFGIYDWEKREPRVRFVTRERLQRMVESLALG
ncbi:MAG: hypothetical protein OEM66_02255 [Acidimicrobiia bacterium]|nr:hypothetical protein [Acidimicrobiia bacterium]